MLRKAALVAVSVVVAGSAAAQTSQPRPQVNPNVQRAPFAGTPPGASLDDIRARLWREQGTREHRERVREALDAATPEQVNRAKRLASLVNRGRCSEARQVALAEGDAHMAATAGGLCRDRRPRESLAR